MTHINSLTGATFKRLGKAMDHMLLRCQVAHQLWSTIKNLFGNAYTPTPENRGHADIIFKLLLH